MCSFYTPLFLCGWFSAIWGQLILKRMACRLSSRWDRSYAEVLWWIRAWLAFAIVQALVLCEKFWPWGWSWHWFELITPLTYYYRSQHLCCPVLYCMCVCHYVFLCIVCITAVFCCVWQEINYIIIIIITYLPITDFMVSRGWEISNL